jgi:GntR family transcriptional regulator
VGIDRRAATPLYLQLKELIAEGIRDGGLQPGDRVGSEAELEQAHQVSRITVRQAIGALVQEGEVYRVPGKGTYVASPKLAPLAAFTSFSENMVAQGRTPSYRVLVAEWVIPPSRVGGELRLTPEERAFQLDRLLLADGMPMCLQHGFYPGRLLRPITNLLTPETLSVTSLYQLLEQRLGLKLGKAEETVEPAIPTREEVKELGISRDIPVLVVNRLSYIVSGEPVETVKLVFRGDRYQYRVNLYRVRHPNGGDTGGHRASRDAERGDRR